MITSTTNPRIKRIRTLQTDRRARAVEGLFVVEGARLVNELLQAGLAPELVLYTPDYAEQPAGAAQLANLSGEMLAVNDAVMKTASDTQTPQGVLAVVPMPGLTPPPGNDFLLVVDGLQNPGNLGAILRSAEAAGVPGILLAPGTVDPFNPKVVRGAAGAHFRLPLQLATWDAIREALAGLTVYLADTDGGAFYDRVDWRKPSALIVGSEGHGGSSQANTLANVRVSIPMMGGAESLNAAVATGILLFEVVRQRGA